MEMAFFCKTHSPYSATYRNPGDSPTTSRIPSIYML